MTPNNQTQNTQPNATEMLVFANLQIAAEVVLMVFRQPE